MFAHEIREYLVERGWMEQSDLAAGSGKELFSFHDETGAGETQLLICLLDEDFVQVISAFAATGEIAAEEAFSANSTVLGIVEFAGHYCVSFVAVNSAFAPGFFEEMARLVGAGANLLSRSLQR